MAERAVRGSLSSYAGCTPLPSELKLRSTDVRRARAVGQQGDARETMKRFCLTVILGGLVAVIAHVSGPEAHADGACGAKGQTPCPLQGWMEKNVQVPLESKDYAKLAAALERAAGFAPDPTWHKGETGWGPLAKASAAAARAGDLKAIKRSCKACHTAWRKRYKAEHRLRKLP